MFPEQGCCARKLACGRTVEKSADLVLAGSSTPLLTGDLDSATVVDLAIRLKRRWSSDKVPSVARRILLRSSDRQTNGRRQKGESVPVATFSGDLSSEHAIGRDEVEERQGDSERPPREAYMESMGTSQRSGDSDVAGRIAR